MMDLLNLMWSFMVQKKVFMKEESGKFVLNFLMHIHTNLLPSALWTKYTTQMLMSYLGLYAWMLLTNRGVQCSVSIVSDLLNVFEVFLPQLLLYPNASDPLNGDAASLMMKDRKLYDQKVKEYCERYAKKENISNNGVDDDDDDDEESDEEDISEAETQSSDDEIPGHADL